MSFNSNDLLSFDFIHDNEGNVEFFKKNNMYNLNDQTQFKINENIFNNKYHNDIEQYVQNIMLTNFEHINHGITNNYSNINQLDNFKYKNSYTLILDNMQCNLKNVLNIKMLLNNPEINIYIPFILCCENINVNSNNNNNNNNNNNKNKDKIINIINSYNNLKSKLIGVNVLPMDFYTDMTNTKLKKEYIDESIRIGFNFNTNKLLRFRNLKELKDIDNSVKKLFDDFLILSQIIMNNDLVFYNNIILEIVTNINTLKQHNYSATGDNNKKFNKIKAMIFSMKEMRDWYYVKEIVNRFNDNTIKEVIYCTADSINLFRAILYNISTINTHNNNIKYFALYDSVIDELGKINKYIIYKQISPSYYYSEKNENQLVIKQKLFTHINTTNTNIITKIKTGGDNLNIIGSFGSLGSLDIMSNLTTNLNKNLFNIKTKNYCVISNKMDYKKIRLELFICTSQLEFYLHNIYIDADDVYNELVENKLGNDSTNYVAGFIYWFNKLKEFTSKYDIRVLKCLNYSPNKNELANLELDYFIYKNMLSEQNTENPILLPKPWASDVSDWYFQNYIESLDFFKYRVVDKFDKYFGRLGSKKFYSNQLYILTPSEEFFSVIFSDVVNISMELKNREYTGYILKIILCPHDYDIIRNVLAIYFDEHMSYPEYIKGIIRQIRTFDENSFEYVDKMVVNDGAYSEFDSMPVEDFEEEGIKSKHKLISAILFDKLKQKKECDFQMD